MDVRRSSHFLRFFVKPVLFVIFGASALDLMLGIYLADLGPDAHETLLHTTGEWALISLTATLAVTPLTKWLSWPHLANVRRMLGLYVAFYATTHFWVYLQFILGFEWAMIAEELVERPYISIGFIAWLMLLPLAVTSNNWSMRRLGSKWKSLHKFSYVIAILAVWHFTWQVKLDLVEPFVYIAILTILLIPRLKNIRISRS